MELDITLPTPVARALSVLEACGYEGYAVGGCVRDSLIGRTPNDWDITTNATPEQMKACFRDFRVIETGIRHAIEKSWAIGDISVLNDVFSYSYNSSKPNPSNTEYISMLAEKVKLKFNIL
jgi:hypothetical protein